MTPSRPDRPAARRGGGARTGAAAPPRRAPGSGSPHVYLLLGEEDVLAEQELRSLLDRLLPGEERALNLDVVDAGETPMQEVITRCETLPFFGARRVVVVRRAGALRAPDQDALATYLERGAPPSVLVLVAETLDRRRRLYGAVQRAGGRVIPCARVGGEALPGWIGVRVQQEGKAITGDAARTLVELVGGGLRELGLEIAKLAAYVGERDTITRDDVHAVASHVAEATVFELMDAVGRRRAERALGLLHTVMTMGEPPLRVLYMLEDQLRMLLRTKALADRGATTAEAREVLGTRFWLYGRYREQVAAFGDMDVAGVLGLLLETDEMIKTGLAQPRLALEALVVRLCVT